MKADYDAIWAKAKWSLSGFPWQHNGRSALAATPEEVRRTFEELWDQGGFWFVFGSTATCSPTSGPTTSPPTSSGRRSATVTDPDTAAKLLPYDHPFGGRRPIIDTGYSETYNRADVTLADLRESPIEEVTPDGIRTATEEVALAVIVLAIGFDAVTGPFTRMDITGRDGVALRQAWADGLGTYLGLAVAGFPNLSTVTGPGATFGNLPVFIEHHVEWIASCIEDTLRHDLDVVAARPKAQRGWSDHVREQVERIVAGRSGSWYDGANIPGKPRSPLFFFGSFGLYRQRCEDVAANGYDGFVRYALP